MASHQLRSQRSSALSKSHSNPRHSDESDDSKDSIETAPTSVSGSPRPSLKDAYRSERKSPLTSYGRPQRPIIIHGPPPPRFADISYDKAPEAHTIPRASEDTCASATTRDIYDEPEEYDDDQDFVFELPEDLHNDGPRRDSKVEVASRATTPQDFADYFPSQRRFLIHHDESSHDGNMNLKIDTEELEEGKRTNVQLFHLRMRDLESREFSLRRYCRDSGREVCNSARRYQVPASARPGMKRSVSNALASLKSDFKRSGSRDSVKAISPVREDSGYASGHEADYFGMTEVETFMGPEPKSASVPTRSMKLEFSNYAHVDVKRCGIKKSKRYDFEYWGSQYSWKRVVEKTESTKVINFHLFRRGSNSPIAHIMPVLQTPEQIAQEQAKGGWVPPCSMWISDPAVLTAFTDVADVIVSTGLIALVDDCIKRHFTPKVKKTLVPTHQIQVSVPMTPLKMEVEFAGPKAIVEHVFRRRSSSGASGPVESALHRQSPLRNSSHAEAQ